jgi:energy-coupling factor transport system ATP-binding protein
MNNEEMMLSCKDLSFRYSRNEEPVFSSLSLTVKKGETVLLMGPSGCGKSTLAYCLAGLYPEYAGELQGEILLNGIPMAQFGPSRRAQTVSILFQNPDNQFCMDLVENEVLFALENINYQGNLRERARELLCQVGLEEVASNRIHTLSGGMKQKLALCTALATGAEMLILDEPFANLDPASCESLAALLRQMNAQGMTLLIVDHRLDWWRPFLSRILLFEKSGNLDERAILPEQIAEQKEAFASRGLFLGNEWLTGRKPPVHLDSHEVIVKADGLTLLHGRKPFLSNLSFQIEKGTLTALVGNCGSGKTTLLQSIAGIGKHKGTLYTAGKAGMVFQNPRFQFLSLSVEEEVLITLRVSRPQKSEEERKAEAEELLREFGLLEWKAQSPYALSQGQQRRLALLAMLETDCPLMLLDEPTYAQDERSTVQILDLLEKRLAEGLTVIMATHDLDLAQAVSNQIFRIEDGRLNVQKGAGIS